MALPISQPKSDGRKRFTPAATAASTSTLWTSKPGAPSVEITASWPLKAAVTESTDEKSAVVTLTEAGNVAVEEARLTTVRLNFPEWMSALRTGIPRDPEAYRY